MSYKDSANVFQKQVRKFRSYTAQMGILDRVHITVTFTYWYMTPQLWKEFKMPNGRVKKFDKFTDFVTDKVHGPGFKLKFFQDIIKCPDAEKELQGMEALNELVKMKEDVRRGVIASIDAIPKHGGNRKQVLAPTLKTERDIKYWTAKKSLRIEGSEPTVKHIKHHRTGS